MEKEGREDKERREEEGKEVKEKGGSANGGRVE